MAAISIDQLTSLNEDGVYDKLTAVMLKHLQSEFSSGRITQTDYSKVFVASMDTVMNQSIHFLLQKDISANQADLLLAQKNLTITQEQAVQKEIELTEANILKVNKEIELLDKQSDMLDKQILLTDAQIDKITKEIEVLEIQKTKLTADVALTNANTALANKQVEMLTAQILNVPKEGELLDKQVDKTTSEQLFLEQRIKTEKAQILDVVDSVNVAGVIGKQKDLYSAQTTGFARDAEFKFAKAMMDTWSVRRSTDSDTVADNTNRLSDANVGVAILKYMNSIGITPP